MDYRARYYDPSTGRFLSEDPLRFLGGSPDFYAYVVNSPTNLVDPKGLTIAVIGDATSVSAAFQYLRKDPGMAHVIDYLEQSDEVYTIATTMSLNADYSDPKGTDPHLIFWNPNLGLNCIKYLGHQYGAALTPAMALGHELAHFLLPDWVGHLRDPIGDYDFADEWFVIHFYENPAAVTLGEGVRHDHKGQPTWVNGPLEKPSCGCTTQLAPNSF